MTKHKPGRVAERSSERPSAVAGFSQYDGERIALVLNYRGRPTMFQGMARFEDDELLGPILRIRLDASKHEGETDVLIAEKEWRGRIVPSPYSGSRSCFIPTRPTCRRERQR